ncbi:polysaccharide pyruvyl transferase family protein [Acuticoccus sediminis]|uniref:Polysaccharide pyruvyl transferase family protein n=1 Tax=Acuticoccus sediminis TaxID=2184697 RepID=A0A8B2NJX5_9HYPH|nr:polysaccharide pyruvyl transferase family protein [Acuticoccus sediminis]RAH98797.1 polysaccharide pyruvyl transferase family protein [Acuticoccus sediminis]
MSITGTEGAAIGGGTAAKTASTATRAPEKTLTVGLVGHSTNSDNFGVGALAASQIDILRRLAARRGRALKVIVFCWPDRRPHYIVGEGIESVTVRGRDLVSPTGALVRNLRRCDLVLDIGAGDSFADIYGVSRFLKVLAPKLATLALRRPLILAPQTIGPFRRGWVRRAARTTMALATTVCTRDVASTEYLREIGYRGRIVEATDVAMRLGYDRPAARTGGPVRVGINVSGLLLNGGYTRSNMFGIADDYGALMRAIAGEFASRPDYELHFVGHVLSEEQEIEDDYRACQKLAAEFPGSIVAPRFGSPSEAKSYIAGLDFFTGARMHACIAAFSSGVPVVPLAYSRKFEGLFSTLGYKETADLRSMGTVEVLTRIRAAVADLDGLRAQIEKALVEANRRLDHYEQIVDEAMALRGPVTA